MGDVKNRQPRGEALTEKCVRVPIGRKFSKVQCRQKSPPAEAISMEVAEMMEYPIDDMPVNPQSPDLLQYPR
jgi:hypothetical protein